MDLMLYRHDDVPSSIYIGMMMDLMPPQRPGLIPSAVEEFSGPSASSLVLHILFAASSLPVASPTPPPMVAKPVALERETS